MNCPEYYLMPQFDTCKSFYDKAKVRLWPGGEKDLISYNSVVAAVFPDGEVQLYGNWDKSQTTLRHVKEFLKQNGYRADSKAQIEADYAKQTQQTPKCDMTTDCTEPIAYLDDSGYVYCTQHGLQRQSWKRCRKLRPHELNKILRGEQLERY